MREYQIQNATVTFWLWVKPGSRRERLGLASSGELRAEVSAPATRGQANQACVRFLARTLRLPEACIVILTGHKSRRKLVRITGRSAEETVETLNNLVGNGPQK